MMRIALIDKSPNNIDYKKYLEGTDFDHYHLCSTPLKKILKKDVDIVIDQEKYDLLILVGSEAAKYFAKVSSITNIAGHLISGKFICMPNPAALVFKPEGKADFLRAVDRIKNIITKGIQVTDGVICEGVSETNRAKEVLREILSEAKDIVAWDTETTGLYPREGYILGLSLTYKDNQGFYILTDCLDDECIELLQQIADRFKPIFQNIKFDKKFIEFHLGVNFGENSYRLEDTMLLHYVLNENESHSLKDLTLKYGTLGNYEENLGTFKKEYCKTHGILLEDFTYDLIPFDIIYPYACKDTIATYQLFRKFSPLVETNEKFKYVYRNLLMEGTLFLLNMEEVGIPINKDRMKAADLYLKEKVDEAQELLYTFEEVISFEREIGTIFNPDSVPQLRKLLFDYIRLPTTGIKTATGADSTSADALEQLAEENDHPIPKAILNIRRLGKLRNTYTSKILSKINRDSRIRTGFNLTFTTSGRLSSSGNFNAQQIPRDNPIIKGCIQASEGYKIVSQDLRTGEMFYASVLSGDRELQKVFIEGGDFHSSIAKQVFNLPCEVELVQKLYPDLRQAAKAISFGILYGSGPSKVALEVSKSNPNYTIDDAKSDISDYFSKFSKLKKWLDSRKKFIQENGYTYSFFGRKRRLPNVFSKDKAIVAHEIRSGINSEVQSLCSDINLLGAIDAAKEIKERKIDASIFMLVHDSIVALVKDEHVDAYCELIARNVQKDRGCNIGSTAIGIDQEIGQDYSFGKFDKYYEIRENKLSSLRTS